MFKDPNTYALKLEKVPDIFKSQDHLCLISGDDRLPTIHRTKKCVMVMVRRPHFGEATKRFNISTPTGQRQWQGFCEEILSRKWKNVVHHFQLLWTDKYPEIGRIVSRKSSHINQELTGATGGLYKLLWGCNDDSGVWRAKQRLLGKNDDPNWWRHNM